MTTVEYKGKTYYEIDPESQMDLKTMEAYSFRYYPKDRLVIISDTMMETFHCSKFYENLPDSMYVDLISPSHNEAMWKIHDRIKAGDEKVEVNLESRDGHYFKISLAVSARDEAGVCACAIGLVENVSASHMVEKLVYALSDNYESVYFVDFIRDEVSPYRMSKLINQQYGTLLHSKPTYASAITAYISQEVDPSEREEMLFETSYENLDSHLQQENVYEHDFAVFRDNRKQYFRIKVVKMNAGEHLERAIIGFADVDQTKKKDLEKYAYVDSLTGGDNYVRFKLKLPQNQAARGYLVSMDIHAFRVVNSVCGTQRGDETLKGIWNILNGLLEEGDMAAHINADHFVLFFQGGELRAEYKLGECREALQQLTLDQNLPKLPPYFGLAPWDSALGETVEMVYGRANIAKHEAKNRKDADFAYYQQIDSTRLIAEKRMEDKFAEAIEKQAFEVWMQPKYDPMNGVLVGAEALVRWRDEEGNLLPPSAFVPLFERNGMIRILDEYVFTTVCRRQIEWLKSGYRIIPISINLSRASLYFQNVVERYAHIARHTGIRPYMVPIEITESAAVANENIRGLTERFQNYGFLIHIDDFGSGYSSMATLNMMQIDTLKLDKSLIDFIGNYGGDRLLIHTVALAKELGMHVTAEGVETEEQVKFLRDIHCDSIQGYFYSKPLSPEDFDRLLQEYSGH